MIVPDVGQLRTNSRINQYSTGKLFRDEGTRSELNPHEYATSYPSEIAPVWSEESYPQTVPVGKNPPDVYHAYAKTLRPAWNVSGLGEWNKELTPPLVGIGIGLTMALISFPYRDKTSVGTIGMTVGGILAGLNAVELVRKMVE